MSGARFEDFLGYGGSADIFAKTRDLGRYLCGAGDLSEQSLGVRLLAGTGSTAPVATREGEARQVVMLGSNSYLDLTRHPKVLEASRNALEKYGYGMGAVSLYAGATDMHRELEERVAAFTGQEDAIVFPGGYATNVGVISALCGKGDVVINDSANHASIFDGCLLSGADVKVYPHNNMKRLEQILARIPESQKGRLIITDGVFSMHGDLAPLATITELAKKYGARLMVDDAHGIGVVGPTGRGTPEVFGVGNAVDLHVSMLSKAPGGLGGYCAGSRDVVRYLRLYARTYFFSTAMPAPVVAGLIEVFKLLQADAAGRGALWENIRYMREGLARLGFAVPTPVSGIIPVVVGDEDKLARFHAALLRAGVYANIVTYPAVRRKECRLRLCVMRTLSRREMDAALDAMEKTGRECGVI